MKSTERSTGSISFNEAVLLAYIARKSTAVTRRQVLQETGLTATQYRVARNSLARKGLLKNRKKFIMLSGKINRSIRFI
ncbi:MAG: hypothetical protein JRM84_07735 [Nitrososphaerota archaeon]|nr:hypothetical protein [Nitrososphaerota archaeon]MDG6944883.1 hypothetical protein [Nitrososphaerota archaeon]